MIRNYLKYLFPSWTLFFIIPTCLAQTGTLTLEECYQLAKANYPAIKKMDLIAKTSEYDLQNANKRYLPQVSFSGQATYQSTTTDFSAVGSIAGITLPSVSKDQYKIQGQIDQIIYDGGITKHQKDLIKANSALQEQNLEATLYAIKQRINSIYFSILLMEAQYKQNELNKANIQTQIQKTDAALANGTAFRSSLDELKAEIVNTDMTSTEYQSNRAGYLKMLSLFIGKELNENTKLEFPAVAATHPTINRPELKAYDMQKAVYEVQEKQLRSDYLPQLSAFFQGAYGRPTLNIIDNKFGPWYIGGIKLNWSLGSLYSLSNKKKTLHMNRQSVDADRETFLLNTKVDLSQQDEQVKKYSDLLEKDEEAIALRASVTKSAQGQLDNGVITTHEYIQKLNTENQARQTKILHEIQLLQAKYNQKFITGN